MWQEQHEAYPHHRDIGGGEPAAPPGHHEKTLAQDIVNNGSVRLHSGECRVKGSNALIRQSYGSGPNNHHLIAKCLRRGGGLPALDDIGDRIAWEAVLTARCRLIRGKRGRAEMINHHPPLLVSGELKTLASRHQPHLEALVSPNGHQRVGIAVPLLQIALQKANAQRREEIALLLRNRCLLRRSRCLPTTPARCAHTPTVLHDERIIPDTTIVGVWTAIEKAVSPDGLG